MSKYKSTNLGGDAGTTVFKNNKYGGTKTATTYPADGSDRMAEHQHMALVFQHVPSTQTVAFKAFITAFNESYSCDWSTEEVYGRTDPIMLFKGNRRSIALNFKVPAYSLSEAYENLGRVQRLSQFLYPNYKEISSAGSKSAHAQTIAQSPLIRLKVMNLLANQNDAPNGETAAKSQQNLSAASMLQNYFNNGMIKSSSPNGLLGAITSFQVNHNLENLDVGVIEHGAGTILPKMIDVTVQFQPIHEHTIGWNDMEPINPHWPYGIQLKTPRPAAASSNSAPNATDDDLPEQARDNAVADAAAVGEGLAVRRRQLSDLYRRMGSDPGGVADMYNTMVDAYNRDLQTAIDTHGTSALGMRDTGAMRHYQ